MESDENGRFGQNCLETESGGIMLRVELRARKRTNNTLYLRLLASLLRIAHSLIIR